MALVFLGHNLERRADHFAVLGMACKTAALFRQFGLCRSGVGDDGGAQLEEEAGDGDTNIHVIYPSCVESKQRYLQCLREVNAPKHGCLPIRACRSGFPAIDEMNRSRSVYHEWFSKVSDALLASAEAMRRSIAYLITVWQRTCPAAHVFPLLHRISCRGAQHFMHIRERLIQRCT